MRKTMYAFGLLLILAAVPGDSNLPKGWIKAGSDPDKYDMYADKHIAQEGKCCATIKSTYENISGFGTLMQSCKPGKYLGKRIKMTGYVKSKDVKNWAGLWLRVDQLGSNSSLSFDNMQDRAIKGTTDWNRYEIVLDVPDNASNIAYGALIAGTGQIWFDNISLEVVADTVKTTGISGKQYKPNDEPVNLNFED